MGKTEALGEYQLTIKPIDMTFKSTLQIKIKEEHSEVNYVIWFFGLTLLLWFLYKFSQWRYKLKINDERGIYIEEDNSEENGLNFQLTIILLIIGIFIMIAFND